LCTSLAKRCTRNVVVKDSKLKGTQKVGALIGFVAENQVKVLNCRVEGVEINNHDIANESCSTAGLIGCIASGNNYIENCWVKNSTINTIQNGTATRANSEFIGVIRGNATVVNVKNCGVEGNTFTNTNNSGEVATPFHKTYVGSQDGTAMLIVNEADAFIGSSAQAIAAALNHPDVETIKTAYIQVYEADGEVVIDMDETSEVTTGSPADYGFIADAGSSLTIDNANINSLGGGVAAVDGAEVTFNGGNLAVNTTSTSGRYLFYTEGEGASITINGGNFSFSKTLNQKRAYIYANAGTTVYVTGGTFGKASTRSGYTAGILGTGTVIITGGTFGFDPSTWVADGYEAVKNGSIWTVVAAN